MAKKIAVKGQVMKALREDKAPILECPFRAQTTPMDISLSQGFHPGLK